MTIRNESGLKPLGSAVLVQPYQVEERTEGGILLPEQVRKLDEVAEQRGIVVEVGPFAWSDEPEPRAVPGDRILYTKYAGHKVVGTKDGKTYRVINARDVFVRIVEEKGV